MKNPTARKSKQPAATVVSEKSKDKSLFVYQKEKVNYDLNIRELPWSEKQRNFIEVVGSKDTRAILVKGLAGTGKTVLSVYCALKALEAKKVGQIIYLRQPVESSKYSLGFLKGDMSEKMAPYLAPLMDKLHELLAPSVISKLAKEEHFVGIPIGHLRGRSFDASYVLFDEAQNGSKEDLLLAMTRVGKFSKLIMFGDTMQSDIKNSAFTHVFDMFNNEESRVKGIYTFDFGKEDIFRSEILAYIIGKFEELNLTLK